MSQIIKNSNNINLVVSLNINQKYYVQAKQNLNINLVDTSDKNTTTNLNIFLEEYASCNLNIYSLSDGFHKNIKVCIHHSSSSTSNTVAKVFVANHGLVRLDLTNKTPKNMIKITQNQSIDGVLFDENSQINVTPSMLIDTNVVKASHAVNIGNINPEQLFYLMSRGLSKTKATMMILNGMFSSLNGHETTQDLYNNVTGVLKRMIKETHENKDK
jgi:Fe-S cluster assembly protein SufD